MSRHWKAYLEAHTHIKLQPIWAHHGHGCASAGMSQARFPPIGALNALDVGSDVHYLVLCIWMVGEVGFGEVHGQFLHSLL
jgi:hypothetical protein